jgi:uncharacterized protein YeaO (DUF488 family)
MSAWERRIVSLRLADRNRDPLMLKTKSVHSPIERTSDGIRILAARHRGRGLPASRYDVWMANLGPSEELLSLWLKEKITWSEFVRRYKAEMRESTAVDRKNRTIKNHGQKFTLRLLKELSGRENLTILCHCAEEETHCHRHILKKLIEAI